MKVRPGKSPLPDFPEERRKSLNAHVDDVVAREWEVDQNGGWDRVVL